MKVYVVAHCGTKGIRSRTIKVFDEFDKVVIYLCILRMGGISKELLDEFLKDIIGSTSYLYNVYECFINNIEDPIKKLSTKEIALLAERTKV